MVRFVAWLIAYLAATTATLWIVAASVVPPSASTPFAAMAFATALPSPTDDLAARVFAPTGNATERPASMTAEPTFAITKEAAERGAALFVIKGCVLCHGQRAEGQFGPKIARTILPFEDVKRQARTPRNVYMPAFTQPLLSEEELTDIYVFLLSIPAE